jgi:hypothetical protein
MNTLSDLEPMTVARATSTNEHSADATDYLPTRAVTAPGQSLSIARAVAPSPLLFDVPPEDREFFNTKLGP